MRLKFFFLMTVMAIVLAISLAVPLTQFEIQSLIAQSKKSSIIASSIIANNLTGNFHLYYIGTDSEKRNFVINLIDNLAPSKKEWKDANYISVIDRSDKIIADTRATEIDKVYKDYRNLPEFKSSINKTVNEYNLRIKNLDKNITYYRNKLKNLEKELDLASGKPEGFFNSILNLYYSVSYNFFNLVEEMKSLLELRSDVSKNRIETIKNRIDECKSKIDALPIEAEMAKNTLVKIKENPLNALVNPLFIDFNTSYTVIYPIIFNLGEKSTSYGTILASISTQSIKYDLAFIRFIAVLITILVLILSIFIIRFYMKIIINPIVHLTNGVREAAKGNLDLKVAVHGRDEIATLGNEFNNLMRIWREKLHMEKYVSKSTVEMISKVETGEFSKEPKRQSITIFFSDVRGFTSYSEKHDPLNVVGNLNAIFAIQVRIIEQNGGDVDKFVGDEIMAVFPTPLKAFKSAVDIQKELAEFNKDRAEKLEVGIGINFGEAVVGSLGGGNHFDWTPIGDTVNIGARLCSYAPAGKIIVSDSAIKKINTTLKGVAGNIKVKGKKDNLKIYTF
jgi:class 3 adenylate cyclase